MKLAGNTVLITGGAAGIGFAFAERFIKAGNKVIVCGRREAKLQEAKGKYPELITRVCDVTKESDRIALFDWVKSEHPDVNVLVNNAGIQQRFHVLKNEREGRLELLQSRNSFQRRGTISFLHAICTVLCQ